MFGLDSSCSRTISSLKKKKTAITRKRRPIIVSFSVLYRLFYMEKVLKVKKVKVSTNRRSSLPQETLLLKCLKHLISTTAPFHTFAHFMLSARGKKISPVALVLLLAVLAQASASVPIRADLKSQALEQSNSDRGGNTVMLHWTV